MYLREKSIKNLAREHGRRVGKGFRFALDLYIEQLVINACAIHNGGKITLDDDVFNYVAPKLKEKKK